MLSKAQEVLLTFIEKEQQRAGTRKLRGKDIPVDFGIAASVLHYELSRCGINASITEAIGLLQELVALKTGVRIMKTSMFQDINGKEEPLFILRFAPPIKDRMKQWRAEQKRMGRTGRTLYLTDSEYQQVCSFVEGIRANVTH